MPTTIEVNGQEYEGFTGVSIEMNLDTLSGTFSLSSTALRNVQSPFKAGQECVIRVENEKVITGFIERISINYGFDRHEIIVEGRDRTCDVIDSSIPESLQFQTEISLKKLIEQVLSKANIPNIKVIDEVGDLSNFKTGEIQSQEVGQTLFDYLKNIAIKKQVFLITDGEGNIVISRSVGNKVPEIIVNDPDNRNSNIKNAAYSEDFTQRFNKYTVKSQGNNAGSIFSESSESSKNLVDKNGVSTDKDIRESRQTAIIPSQSYSREQVNDLAVWETNIRRIQSIVYTCTVQGFLRFQQSGIWKINQLVQVVDRFCKIDAFLLINNVKYTYSVDEGSLTELTFVDQDAYKKQAERPIATAKSNEFGIF